MSDNYIVINGKRAELTEEQLKQLGIEVPKNKRWRANDGPYWFVGAAGYTVKTWDCRSEEDDMRFYSHNYFKTEKEAEKYARVIQTETLLRKYADEHNEKDIILDGKSEHYIISYNNTCKEIDVQWARYTIRPRAVYFSNSYVAWAAIEEIGEKRIKEYLTYPW